MSGVTIQFPPLYAKQHDAFFNDARLAYCEATTKAGKSVGGLVWQGSRAINVNPGGSRLWVEPVYPLAKVMFERVIRLFTRMDPNHESGWDTNKTDLVFTYPGGSKQFFRGSDRPDLIYGPDYEDVVIDEASRCKEEAFHAARSTTTATRGPIRCIGNVRGRKNWFYRGARKAEAGEPNTHYARITCDDAVDAGVLDRDEIEQARAQLPEHVFKQLYMAEAADDEGNPFGIEAIGKCIAPLSTQRSVAFGWDLAKSVDWTVGIGLDAGGRTSAFRRFQMPWEETTDEVVNISRGVPTVIDSTGVGDPIVERVQKKHRAAIGYKFTAQSKQQLMEGLAVAIQRQEIRFPDGPIKNELEAFEYSYTAFGVRYSAPEGMHDDCVCALALAVHAFRDRRNHIASADVIPNIPAWHAGLDLG